MNVTCRAVCCVLPIVLLLAAHGADPPPNETFFFDETTMRHLRLKPGEFGNTEVEVRFASEPGGLSRWVGSGQRKDKQLVFSRTVGEGEDRGPAFVANVSESKVEISFRPGQKEPADAGINGTYRKVSESKRLQLAKKELEAANERLVASLKAAGKSRSGKEREAMTRWREQWPAKREAYMNIVYTVAGTGVLDGPGTPASSNANAPKDPRYWMRMAEATAKGFYFVEAIIDPKTGTGWDGEYDDFSGGHLTIRTASEGKLRLFMSFYRSESIINEGIEVVAPADKVVTSKDGAVSAEFVYKPLQGESATAKPSMTIRLTKFGRYIEVQTEGAEKHAGRGWFDGIYRGAPVPEGG